MNYNYSKILKFIFIVYLKDFVSKIILNDRLILFNDADCKIDQLIAKRYFRKSEIKSINDFIDNFDIDFIQIQKQNAKLDGILRKKQESKPFFQLFFLFVAFVPSVILLGMLCKNMN